MKMRKLLLLMTALLTLGVSGAWADVLTLTPSNGTYVTGSGNYVNSITFSTTPAITVTASANNMDKRLTDTYLQWHSGTSSSSTYTISVAGDYAITGYSVTGEANTSAQTLTAGSNSHEFAVGTSSSFEVTGLKSSSVSFVQTGDNASGLKITSISVTVVPPTDEQIAAYNTAKGWTASIQTAEGLVTDANNYSGNAIITSGDGGGLPTLLDNNTSTYCHTAYNGSGVANPGANHYIQAYIEDGTDAFYLYTYKRNDNNRPTQIDITASNDGSNWTSITSLTSGLTTTADFLSDKISLEGTYKYIRFTVPTTNTGNKYGDYVFFTYSEFWLLPSNSHVDDAVTIIKSLSQAVYLTQDEINDINTADLAVRSATIAPWKAAFIASAGESSNFGKVGWPSASAYSTFCDAINALTVDDDYETDAATAMATLWGTVSYPATGYYYLHNKGTNRYAFSDETISSSQDYLNDESRTSKYIWKVTLDGTNIKVYSLTGRGITLNNQGGEQKGNLALETPDANSYTAARGAFYMGSIQDPNQASFTKDGTAYVSATNPMKLTHYNGGSGANKGDRQGGKAYWIFEPVDVSAIDIYTVNFVNAPGDNYVTYSGSATTGNLKVYDGGCYFMTKGATVSKDQFTPEAVANYDVAVSISDKVITVTYTVASYITYTLTDVNGATYEATIPGEPGVEPEINGCYGYTLSNKNWSGSTFTADIDFGFPVSSNSVNNATAIKSSLGSSLWYAKDGNVIADNSANTPNPIYNTFADNYRWYIYPVFNNGTFSFKLYNVGAAKYIPSNPSTELNTATTLTADAASVGAFQFAHYNNGNGFYDTATSKFLTINTSGTAQNIWLWTAPAGTGHMGSAMSFPPLTTVSVSDVFATLKNATKFDILDGSTVMGPSEFAAPAEINDAIDAAKNVGDTDEAKLAFIQSDNGTKIQNYLNQVATYGALATVKITMSKEYGTMILPCPCTRIDGLDIYSCSAQENGVLTLTPVDGDYSQNVPYIIHATAGSKYTIIGWDKGSTATHTSGWLTGVLNSTTDIPGGSYMLATNKTTGVQAFYQVSGEGVKCAINKCYLTVSSGGSVKAFYFDEDGKTTAIEEIFGGEAEQGAIYNLAGQRLQKLQKGINIINGKKIIK